MLAIIALASLLLPRPSKCSPAQIPSPPCPREDPIKHRCMPHDPCWPSADDWKSFNASINGRLLATYPSAATCHQQLYDEQKCEVARQNWTSSFWRTSQPGVYTALVWEDGDDTCPINVNSTNVDLSPCGQGRVATYTVIATTPSDIKAAVHFADRHKLLLTVKNTGHDHLGRSSSEGSFAIWTHNLKGRVWHDGDFVPQNAPPDTQGMHAVTLSAGEQWLDVYSDAAIHNRTVVGGSARTVGAVGGYLTGGGHSPFAARHGLAVDNLLEATLVAPNGTRITLNAYTDPDYFWALRGGAGSIWGVILNATYKNHDPPTHIQTVLFQATADDNSTETLRALYERILPLLPDITGAGYTGYASLHKQLGFIFSKPGGDNASYQAAFAPFLSTDSNGRPSLLADIPNTSLLILPEPLLFPTFQDYASNFLTDPNIATNVQDASRLLTPTILRTKAREVADSILSFPETAAGFNFLGEVDKTQDRSLTSVHPIWARSMGVFSLGVDWEESATLAERRRKRQMLVEISQRFDEIVGVGKDEAGAYVNEANPYEPRWQEVFWGSNYDRLLSIKKRIDPRNLFVCNRCIGTDVIYEP